MAIDYNIPLSALGQMQQINAQMQDPLAAAKGMQTFIGQQQMGQNFANRPAGMSDIDFKNQQLATLGSYSPEAAFNIMTGGGKTGRPSVFELKQQAAQTPEVQKILKDYDEITNEAVQAISADPKANISGYLQKLGTLENQYKQLTGTTMGQSMTGAMVRQIAQERGYIEQNEDDTYNSVNEIVQESSARVEKDLKALAEGTPELKKAIALLKNGTNNPAAINSAMKIYVKALDNSAVMQGEIAGIAGDSWLGRFKGWLNGIFTGTEMSQKQIKDLWEALKIVSKAHNNAVGNIQKQVTVESDQRIALAERLGRIPTGQDYNKYVNDIVKSRTSGFYVSTGDGTPAFQDVIFGTETQSGNGGKGEKGGNAVSKVSF